MKENKKKMFLLFVFFPLLIALGISTWIIVTYDSTQPKYNANSQYFIDYNGKTGVYSGKRQGPTSDSGNLVDLPNVKFTHRLISDSINNFDDGLPIDAGEYFIYIESTTDPSLSTDIYFKIEPFKFRVGVIEQDYSSSTRNWSDIRDGFNSEKVKFYEEDGITELTNLPSDYKDYIDISNLDMTITDGINEFNSSPSGNLIGSTYLLEYFMPNTKNYAVYDVKTDSYNSRYDSNKKEFIIGSTLFKYNTVKTTINNISNTYCTIEDALIKGTGNIVLCGDETSDSSYVQTSFTSLNYAYNTLSYDLDGRTLIVPADSSNSELITSSLSNIVYSVLKIPSGITINVKNNGIINVSAFINTNTIVERRGIIMNDGTIDVISGEVRSYGYIKSSSTTSTGLINCQSGTTIIDNMTIHDYPGGNTTSQLNGKTLPISAWTMHNISCKTEIIGYTKYKIYVKLAAAKGVTIHEAFSAINDTNPLFKSKDENSKITKKAINKNNDLSLYKITGSNQLREQRDEFIIDGYYEDSIFKISVSGVSMQTSKESLCPIGFLDITINSGTLDLISTDYLFMPDTYIRVNESGKLYIGDGVGISFEKIENLNYVVTKGEKNQTTHVFTNYHNCVNDAKLFLSGELEIHQNGRLGGLVIPEKENLTLDFSSVNSLFTSYTAKQHAVGASDTGYYSYKVNKHPVSGYIIASRNEVPENEDLTFTNSTYTSVSINNKFYWLGSKGTNATSEITPNAEQYEPSICVASGTIIYMADGTTKKVENVKTGDEVLVFNHFTGEFDTSIVMYNAHDKEEWRNVDIINLVFDNGTTIKMINEHAFFNLTLNEYTVFTYDNVESFIGQEFFVLENMNNIVKSSTKLIDVYYTNEYTGVYSPVTINGLNCFTDGLLSITGDMKGFYNIFEFDENQKYDEELMKQDIEKYGLYTYEDFKDYVPEILFNVYQGQYLKVAVGKGDTTFEEILQLIEKYVNGEKLPDDFVNMFPQ